MRLRFWASMSQVCKFLSSLSVSLGGGVCDDVLCSKRTRCHQRRKEMVTHDPARESSRNNKILFKHTNLAQKFPDPNKQHHHQTP